MALFAISSEQIITLMTLQCVSLQAIRYAVGIPFTCFAECPFRHSSARDHPEECDERPCHTLARGSYRLYDQGDGYALKTDYLGR